MGIVPKVAWGAWSLQQLAVPILGNGTTLGGAAGMYDITKGQPTGKRAALVWREFYDVLMIRAAGVQPSTGNLWTGPEGFATWKEVVGPVIATGVDWGISRLVGRAARRLRLPGLKQLIGSK